jgi:DNA-binding transcriptional regulator GbsR (MarR family)
MSEGLQKAQDIFLERINQICREYGLNNIMAQLYAVLYLSNKSLSLNEMAERLKISKGSVSINIRALERYGVVRRVWVKGSRKDYYEAETDISRVILDRIKSMASRRLSEIQNMINAVDHSLNSVNPKNIQEKESAEIFKQRIAELKKLYQKAQSLFNLFNSGIVNGLLTSEKAKSKKIPFDRVNAETI